ncbi:MAG: BREX-1 system adenine-specific DNA-methyltransferase PglX, partial [Eubacterium sp.]|nr:BREX-1 system adenine-specific DNA-methyltransferase PglX [Eubacterium sp.]
MDKNAIKNFAIWARNKLIESVSYQAGLMGVTAEEIKAPLPQSTKSAEFYDIGTEEPYAITGEAITQRAQLVDQIRQKEQKAGYADAYKFVMEQVAYTWFNRLIAVRFMEVNDYLPSRIRVLSSESGKLEPDIVTNPFDAELDYTPAEEARIRELKQNNRTDELFRLLFIKQCNALNEVLPYLFERTSDYTELLLSLSVVDRDGVIYHLVHDIPEESFDVEKEGQVEIIGWLYQYYNTELKDETFALLKKNKKITKERIPSATQLFTPHWIVQYMVENSLGRLWVDHLRAIEDNGLLDLSKRQVEVHQSEPGTLFVDQVGDFTIKKNWKYYLEEAEQEPDVQKQLAEIRREYATLRPEEIKVIDPCMGSGHILVYLFEVLMQIYESQGWEKRKAARSILENNLYGLDIDERASQLAYFSVMMKAREYDRRILTQGIRP